MLDAAIKTLATTNQDLELVARGLVVSPAEVYDALSKAEPDSVEFVVLTILAKYNPYVPQLKPKK